MSYKCEHGKDSDVCVKCWEEANLDLDSYFERERLRQTESCHHAYSEDSTVCIKCGT